jgi:hypothetical protein
LPRILCREPPGQVLGAVGRLMGSTLAGRQSEVREALVSFKYIATTAVIALLVVVGYNHYESAKKA